MCEPVFSHEGTYSRFEHTTDADSTENQTKENADVTGGCMFPGLFLDSLLWKPSFARINRVNLTHPSYSETGIQSKTQNGVK